MLTLTGDSGTWSVTLYAAAADRPLKRLRHADAFTAVVRALPRHAHWLEGEPLTGVLPMGGVIDRLRAGGAADAGRAERRRRLGVHEPDAGPRHRGRARARRAAARRRARAVRRRARGRLARAHRRASSATSTTRVSRATADGSPRWRRTARSASRPRPRPGRGGRRRAAAGHGPRRGRVPRRAGDHRLPGARARGPRACRAWPSGSSALAGSAPPPELERGALLDLIAA